MADLAARVLPTLALRPWERRPDEPVDDWCAFLVWLLTRPRPPVLPEGARAAAVQWDWLRRAAMAEHALAPRDDPRVLAEQIARNALGILHREMAARFAECDRTPGMMPLPELFKLFALVAQFESRIPQGAEESRPRMDVSKLTPAEAAQLSYLLAKCYRPGE